MKRNIITITRQFGSLGRPIGKEVAKELGLKYYDRDIIDLTAKNMGLPIDEFVEFESNRISLFDRMMYPLGMGTMEEQKRLLKIEKSVIMELATYDDCVIVGRCMDHILKDISGYNVMSVYIHAPYEKRLENSIQELGLSEKNAKKYINGVDKARADLYKYHAGISYDSASERNISIDSSFLGFDGTVKLICEAARMRFDQR